MMEWADFKFGPINLWNVWPSAYMQDYYNERITEEDRDLWELEDEYN